jgi:cell division protein FtsB
MKFSKILYLVAVLTMIFALVACSAQQTDAASKADVDALKAEVEALKAEVDAV